LYPQVVLLYAQETDQNNQNKIKKVKKRDENKMRKIEKVFTCKVTELPVG